METVEDRDLFDDSIPEPGRGRRRVDGRSGRQGNADHGAGTGDEVGDREGPGASTERGVNKAASSC